MGRLLSYALLMERSLDRDSGRARSVKWEPVFRKTTFFISQNWQELRK